ncbi:MAG: threonine/serine exporter family protein [Eubacterium ramulus]
MEAIRNEENMQQLKSAETDHRHGEALLCYGAEISRVEETIQRVADHFQIEEVEMYVITNGLFVNVHQQEEHTSTRLKYVPSISVNMKKLCDINELSRRIEQENLSVDTAFEDAGNRFGRRKTSRCGNWCFPPVLVRLLLVSCLAEACGIVWLLLCAV